MMKKIIFLFSAMFLLFGNGLYAISPESREISVKHYNHGVVPLNAVRLPLMKITVHAFRDISVSGIKLYRSGLSSWDDFGNIWLETGNYQKSLRGRLNSNDYANIRFRNPVKIFAGNSESFTVYVNLNLYNSGNTFRFSLEDVVINEQNPAKSSRYESFRNYRRNRHSASNFSRVSRYSIPSLEFSALGTSSEIQIGENAEVGKFRLFNSGNKDTIIKSIRLKNYGKSDLEKDFDRWSLSNNGIEISTSRNVSKNYITFTLDNYIIEAGDAVIVSIKNQLIYGSRNHTIQLGVQYSTDIVAKLRNTDANAAVKLKSSKLKRYPLGNGDWNFIQSYYQNSRNYNRSRPTYRTRSNYSYTNSKTSYAPGSKDVLFLHQYFHERYDFRAEGIFIPVSSNQNTDSLNNSYNDFRLFIDGKFAGSANNFEYKNGRWGLFFRDNFEANKNSELRIIGRISHNAESGSSLTFNFFQAQILEKEWAWQ